MQDPLSQLVSAMVIPFVSTGLWFSQAKSEYAGKRLFLIIIVVVLIIGLVGSSSPKSMSRSLTDRLKSAVFFSDLG